MAGEKDALGDAPLGDNPLAGGRGGETFITPVGPDAFDSFAFGDLPFGGRRGGEIFLPTPAPAAGGAWPIIIIVM